MDENPYTTPTETGYDAPPQPPTKMNRWVFLVLFSIASSLVGAAVISFIISLMEWLAKEGFTSVTHIAH